MSKLTTTWITTALLIGALMATGCTVFEGAECSSDDECEDGEQCVRGGGLLVRDGVCVNPDEWESIDAGGEVGGDARDAGDADMDPDVDTGFDADADAGDCPPPLSECGGECVDLDTDLDHCGGCGEGCSSVEGADVVCQEGQCVAACDGALDMCDGACVDLASDVDHCGGCGTACADDESCVDGNCRVPCDPANAPYGGGEGSEDNPYAICDADHLSNMAAGDELDGHFVLADDIDLEGEELEIIASYSGDYGDWDAPFAGVFDGYGFEIRNLTLDKAQDAVGLFGVIDGGVVRDVKLVGVEVTGLDFVGALAGINYGNIEGVVAEVDVSGQSRVGGLVGANGAASKVASVEIIGEIEGDEAVGGAVGRNAGEVIETASAANVMGASKVGGVAGDNYGGDLCRVDMSEATGMVMGVGTDEGGWMPDGSPSAGPDPTGMVGGLVGRNDVGCVVYHSWASADVDGGNSSAVGGLVGWGRPESTIVDSHASGDVMGRDFTGGLVGRLASIGNEDWEEDGPSVIASAAEGDVSGVNSVGGLAGRSEGTIADSLATGSVEGEAMVGGLVGHLRETYFGTAGGIEDCAAEGGGLVVGESEVGGLVGRNNGVILRSRAEHDVAASEIRAGGLVGHHFGDIQQSFAGGDVETAVNAVGGLIGRLTGSGTVYDSYATGAVEGIEYVGGLVGAAVTNSSWVDPDDNGDGVVARTYSTGEVNSDADQYVGGLIGNNDGGLFGDIEVEDSYWNVDTSGQDDSDGGQSLTDAEFEDEASFEDWDFDDIWDMAADRPVLGWE